MTDPPIASGGTYDKPSEPNPPVEYVPAPERHWYYAKMLPEPAGRPPKTDPPWRDW